MGPRKRTKADVGAGTDVDGPSAPKIVQVEGMDISEVPGDTNMLITMPKKKNKDKRKVQEPQVKKLSKKERKRLTNILQRKEKKDKREELLSSLAKHQATEEEMKLFTSITEVYSQNFKSAPSQDDTFQMKANAIKGSKKRKKLLTPKPETMEEESTDTDDVSTDEEVENIMAETEAGKEEEKIEEGKQEEKPEEKEKMEIAEKQEPAVSEAGDAKPAETPTVKPKPATFVPVNRPEHIQEARLKLPILAEEQVVMETINDNPAVIICGETGSGKTTQVPQFLYEAGYAHGGGKICVTEPRRVAAISMSQRVAMEMSLTSREVSYQIRFEGNVTRDTKIKFVTDGVLLKEAQQDPLLSQYSVVIIDEAHERSVYTDILIGLLSIIVRQRAKRNRPLKLIIMSATLRVEDFSGQTMFKVPPPLVKVEARQFPVTIHFNKKTPDDYLTEAYKKVCKIHRTLPDGGILVFVTGQQEVHTLVKKLRRMFPYTQGQEKTESGEKEKQSRRQRKRKEEEETAAQKENEIANLPEVSLDNYSVLPQDDEEAEKLEDEKDDDVSDNEDEEEEAMRARMGEDKPDSSIPMYVLPLYSLLPSEKQAQVFQPPPEGCRMCVIATNVAETSLTIPNVRYVVDTGKTKTKLYDPVTGVSTFRVTSVSQASADQRAGRAGRTGPGHCYRLYSSAVFSDLVKFSPPEISRRPVEDLVLQMKSMRIDKVANFPFPTPPQTEQIKSAESLLIALGALRKPSSAKRLKEIKAYSPVITELGQEMACFPVSPRYAKMLVLGKQQKVLPYVIALVSALSVGEIWDTSLYNSSDEDERERHRHVQSRLNLFKSKLVGNTLLLGDMMLLLTAVGACEAEGCSTTFCQQLGVRVKAMREIRKLRMHLTNAANLVFPNDTVCVDPQLPPPSEEQVLKLRKVVLGGLADHLARRNPPPPPGTEKTEVKRLKGSFQCMHLEEPVYIHPESVLFGNTEADYVVYQAVEEMNGKLLMRGICCVESHWFPAHASAYCSLLRPLEDPPPSFDPNSGKVMCHRSGTFGRCNWEIPATEVEYPDSVDKYRWFARFLLEGQVFPGFAEYSLLLSPSTMVKAWAKLQPKTEHFLNALLNKGTGDRESLRMVWEKEPKFLQKEFMEWAKESDHANILMNWPPLS